MLRLTLAALLALAPNAHALTFCVGTACTPIDSGALGPLGNHVTTYVGGIAATYPCVRCEFNLAGTLYADGDPIFRNSME